MNTHSHIADELERRFDENLPTLPRDINNNGSDGDDTITSQQNQTQKTALDVLLLLSKELPKLVGTAKSEAPTSPVVQDQTRKRRRQADDMSPSPHSCVDESPPLPVRAALEAVVEAYFDNIHSWIPLIHKTRFLQALDDSFPGDRVLVILHAMVVAAAKFVPTFATYSASMLEKQRQWVVFTAMSSLSMENLQALVILAWDDIGNGNATNAWPIVGSLTRAVECMQLTQEQFVLGNRPLCRPHTVLPETNDWTALEERRRVFWNVFLLDRLCSVMMGWSTGLTSIEVHRRLPCDGILWRKETPALTPFFGIWDKSSGSLGQPIALDSRQASPAQSENAFHAHMRNDGSTPVSSSDRSTTDISSIGALAYNIEATESMSRIMTHFLQQRIDLSDPSNISAWLFRFKELDLRLVRWKMLLPQKWKANPNLTRQVPFMDPNLTIAHLTHNASMILLHQAIAYPPEHWKFKHRLPSACSAEACCLAGIEISTISTKYLVKSHPDSPVSSQFAFCLFLAARVLLIHWRYSPSGQLAPEFWALIQSLEELSRRWNGFSDDSTNAHSNVFKKYMTRLQQLHEHCILDESFQIDPTDYTNDLHRRRDERTTPSAAADWPGLAQPLDTQSLHVVQENWPGDAVFTDPHVDSNFLIDQNFLDMERIIAFDDGSMFTVIE